MINAQNNSLQKEHIFSLRIYYEDTDVLGMVHNTNHIKFMERARSEWLLARGIEERQLLNEGCIFVVRSIKINYFKPIRFQDEIEVVTNMDAIHRVSIDFSQKIRMKNAHEIVFCEAKVQAVCLNNKLKPVALPAELLK